MEADVLLFKREKGKILIPLFSERIHAGFESPATDYQEERIDLNEYVTKYPDATFYARVIGDCMINSGIFDGDLLVVDKSLIPQNGDIVVGILESEFILRAYYRFGKDEYLMPDNPNYSPIKRSEGTFFEIWGVVPFTVHNQQTNRNVRINRLQQLLR